MVDSFLPSKDRKFLESKGFSFREISDGAQKGLVIDSFLIKPDGKFSVSSSSLLVILPTGYPDVPPDMFYFQPELRLSLTNAYPAQADLLEGHFGQVWQRWSRHAPASEWRVGVDNLQSYLQRVLTALLTA